MCGHVARKPSASPAESSQLPAVSLTPTAAPAGEVLAGVAPLPDVEAALKSDAARLNSLTSTQGMAGVSRFGGPAQPSAEALARQNQQRLNADLLRAQESIVARFGTLHISPFSPKITQFSAEGGYMPSHLYDVVSGMGMTLARVHEYGEGHEPNLLEPDLLFYVPANPEKPGLGGNFTDLIADGDYVLAGWGYYADYTPGEVPQMQGLSTGTTIPEDEWFIHEAGWHTIDGGFEATPPRNESWRGQSVGAPPTRQTNKPHTQPIGAHGRVWDLHVFRSDLETAPASAPTLSILAPENMDALFPAQTLDLTAGFFYPEKPAEDENAVLIASGGTL